LEEIEVRITFGRRVKDEIKAAYQAWLGSLPHGTVVPEIEVIHDGEWKVQPAFVDYLRASTSIPFQT